MSDFVFLDENGLPFYVHNWDDEKWLFYWRKDHWVSLRPIRDYDIFPINLSENEQRVYHNTHAQWEKQQYFARKFGETENAKS